MAALTALVLTTAGCVAARPESVDTPVAERPTPVAAAPALSPVGVNGGSMMLVEDDAALRRSLEAMNDLGVTMLRLDIAWPFVEPVEGMFNWAPIDRVVDAARRRGIGVVGVVDYTPQWQTGGSTTFTRRPASADDFGRFAGDVATHLSGRVRALEIWNEPNGGFFFRPGPDPEYYTTLLKAAYRRIKAADPQITVIGGSVATAVDSTMNMNGLTFVKRMYAAGAGRYLDALSVHPYSYPASYSTDPLNPDAAMRMVTDMYGVMRAAGDGGKRIWATEVGFPTSGTPESDPTTQSDVVTESIREWSQLSFAGPVLIQELRDREMGTTGREDSFGIMRADFSAKPLYSALKSLVAGRVNDDVVFQRALGAAARSSVDIGGPVTAWYRRISSQGTPQIRQEFTGGAVTCSRDRCFASPGPVVGHLDRSGSTPIGPFVDGRQDLGDVVTSAVFWSRRSGVHILAGEMLEAWRPEFGLPVTDEYHEGGFAVVRCEHATLRQPRRGSVTVDPA